MIHKILILLVTVFFYFAGISQPRTENPKRFDPGSFSWILLPDPQTYQKFERNQPLFDLMINWIKDQKEELKIQLVFCEGDLVEQNNISEPDSINGDQNSYQQWHSVSNGFSKLDGVVPYILCTGNHDYGIKSAENRYSQFNSYFPPQGNPLNLSMLVEMAPNAQGVLTLENACYHWKSPFGQNFLIFSIEFAPRMEILQWARQLAAKDEYQDYTGVVITHSYQDSKGVRTDKEKYPLTDANYGKTIWKEFVEPSDNIEFVFCGHVADSESHEGQVSYRKDVNHTGNAVHQMLFNAQREGGGWHGNGGDGWLRILEFLPDRKTVKVYTFSPLFWISPSTRHLAWRTETFDQYDISY